MAGLPKAPPPYHIPGMAKTDPPAPTAPTPSEPAAPPPKPEGAQPREIGGPKGPEPTRHGDWEYNGRCTDF